MQSAGAAQLDRPVVSSRPRLEIVWIASLGVLALAAALRFWRLPDQLFIQADDAWHIALIQRFARDNILDYTQARPMYPYLLGRLARLVDVSPFFPAQVSAASGVLLTGVVLAWTRARAGLLAGLTAALLVAVSQLEIYFSKSSSPIAPAMLLATLGYVCLGMALVRQLPDRWPGPSIILLVLGAGGLASLAVTMHRGFLPIPFFLLGFLILACARPGHHRSLVLVIAFVLASLLPVLVAQYVTEHHQPPNINNFGYLNQLKGSFDQQNEWRSGPGGRGWLFYLAGFWETEGPLSSILAVGGVGLGVWRWIRFRDWWSGLLVSVVLATFGYASVASAGGGITVLRAVAPVLPLVSVLSGLAIAQVSQAQIAEQRLFQLRTVLVAAVGLSGLVLSWPVVNAQTGFLRAMDLVRGTGGFAASFDGDPWRVLTAPLPVILVGPKALDRSAQERARDRSLVSGPCVLLLEHYELSESRIILGGLADLSLVELGTPLGIFENTRDVLTPARVEVGDVPLANELRVYLEPPPCRQVDSAPSG